MRLFAVTAARSDDIFLFGAAPMSIPLDIDTPAVVAIPLLIPGTGASIASHTATTTVTGVLVTAAVEVLRFEAYLFVPASAHIYGRFRIRVPWEVTAAGNPGSRGRVTATIMRRRAGSISALSGVDAYVGRIRPLDAIGRYNETNLIVQVPHSVGRYVENDDIVFRLTLDVTTAAAGGAMATVVFHHDPGVPNDAMVVETDWQLPAYDGVESR